MSIYEFGLEHVSPSNLSRFQNDRASWVAGYLYKIWGDGSPAMWRGKAVEAGLDYILNGRPDYALTIALERFEKEACGEADDKTQKEREAIEPMLDLLAGHVEGFSQPISTQSKLTHERTDFPIIGYPDYIFDDHCVDLKTTLRMPSAPKPDHVIQASFYAAVRGDKKASLLYVTPKKIRQDWIGEEQIYASMELINARADALTKALKAALLLAASEGVSAEHAMALMSPPDFNSFYWDDATMHMAVQRIPAWEKFVPYSEAA